MIGLKKGDNESSAGGNENGGIEEKGGKETSDGGRDNKAGGRVNSVCREGERDELGDPLVTVLVGVEVTGASDEVGLSVGPIEGLNEGL